MSALDRFQKSFTPNYRPADLVVDRGEGCYVFDTNGKKYLDLTSGIAVSALGHNHPELIAAIKAQVDRVLHTSNLYMNQPSLDLAEELCKWSFAESVYFCNSGTEANEAALKLARRFAWDQGEKTRNGIVSFSKSFHGRSLFSLSATAQPKYHEGFGPMPEGFTYVEYGDVEASMGAIGPNTAAVIVEPLQGEGGVRLPPPGFLAALREQTKAAGALLIFDEVQVGVGRTGKMFCYEHEGVVPDIMTLAKGVGGGLPLGAMVTTKKVGASLAYGTHASTFGGNPVACAAGLVVLAVVSAPGFLEAAAEVAAILRRGCEAIAAKAEVVTEVRGRGHILGLQLSKPRAKEVVVACRERGVLVHVAGADVVRLVPPLVLSANDASAGLDVLAGVLVG